MPNLATLDSPDDTCTPLSSETPIDRWLIATKNDKTAIAEGKVKPSNDKLDKARGIAATVAGAQAMTQSPSKALKSADRNGMEWPYVQDPQMREAQNKDVTRFASKD